MTQAEKNETLRIMCKSKNGEHISIPEYFYRYGMKMKFPEEYKLLNDEANSLTVTS